MPLARFGQSAVEVESVVRVVNQEHSVLVVFRDGSSSEFEGEDADAFREWVQGFPEAGSLATPGAAGSIPALGPAPGQSADREVRA